MEQSWHVKMFALCKCNVENGSSRGTRKKEGNKERLCPWIYSAKQNLCLLPYKYLGQVIQVKKTNERGALWEWFSASKEERKITKNIITTPKQNERKTWVFNEYFFDYYITSWDSWRKRCVWVWMRQQHLCWLLRSQLQALSYLAMLLATQTPFKQKNTPNHVAL